MYLEDTGYSFENNGVPSFNCEMNFLCDGFNAIGQCAKGKLLIFCLLFSFYFYFYFFNSAQKTEYIHNVQNALKVSMI